MAENELMVYQLRITILYLEEEIYRTILVPSDYTFWDLSVAINAAFDVPEPHTHTFLTCDIETGGCEFIVLQDEVDKYEIDGRQALISEYLTSGAFVDEVTELRAGWNYAVELEEIKRPLPQQTLPVCVDGDWASPPPYCANPEQYAQFFKLLCEADDMESFEEFEEKMRKFLNDENFEWDDYDVNYFDPARVQFSNFY